MQRVIRDALAVSMVLGFVTLIAFAQTTAPITGKFVGRWVEDPSKRTIGGLRNLTFRTTNGALEELRGSYASPLVQPVRFGAQPYSVDQSRNTIAWKQVDATHFERAIFQNGQLINTRRIQVSADGAMLTEAVESTNGGNKTTDTTVYRRISGTGPGLTGVWKPQSFKSDTPDTLRIEAAGNGLRLVTNEQSSGRTSVTLTFDGKPSMVEGAAVISGTANASKLVNDRSIELAGSREGVPTGRTMWTLSEDGRTLTTTTIAIGPGVSTEPSVIVYRKQ